jgi:hypothetical protein
VDPTTLPYFRREVFPAAGPVPWLDRPDALESIKREVEAGRLSRAEEVIARHWVEHGYVILPGFFSEAAIDSVWAEYEAAIASGVLTPPRTTIATDEPNVGRLLNPHFKVAAVDAMLRDRQVLDVVGMLMGAKPLPFQTIIGHKGSEQLAHSDTIHMTTYPMGYLIASWTAMEDIHPDSGPLVYYPGSHRLPYLTSADIGIPLDLEKKGPHWAPDYRARYEPAIAQLVSDHHLEPAYFTPRAGDVFLWHANLLHGGSPRRDVQYSRKALVCHYFAEGCITYHDLSARLSHLDLKKLSGIRQKFHRRV